jgi:hypothetical protein
MRAIIKVLAVTAAFFGVVLIGMGVEICFVDMRTLTENPQLRVFGLLFFGAIGGWFLYAAIRFLRRPNADRALSVCKLIGGVVFVLLAAYSPGGNWLDSINPVLAPFVGLGVAAALYFGVLRPLARRAYRDSDPEDDAPPVIPVNAKSEPASTPATAGPAVFVPTAAFYQMVRRRTLLLSLPLCVGAIAVGLYIGSGPTFDWVTTSIVGVILLATMITTSIATLRRQLRSLQTFRIELGADTIRRTQTGFPSLEIRYADFVQITDTPNQGLLIAGRGKHDRLFLSRHLSDFAILRDRLSNVCAIDVGPPSLRFPGRTLLVTSGGLACMIVAFRATQPWLVTATASALIALFAAAIFLIARNPFVDARLKRTLWTTGIVIAALALRIWSVWSAGAN